MGRIPSVEMHRAVVLFTKPPRPGKVKTRLIGRLTADQACELHSAFLDDLRDRLAGGEFGLYIAWALEGDEPMPSSELPAFRQEAGGLGERLHGGLERAARRHDFVMAIGSDHPELSLERVHQGFEELERGHDVALGPAEDGGYYLIAVAADRLARELFEGHAWSTSSVTSTTLARCDELGLSVAVLPIGSDVDTPADLDRLSAALRDTDLDCPRTRRLLEGWQLDEARGAPAE